MAGSKWSETYQKIITSQPDIKLGQFTEKELEAELKKIKDIKAANLDEIPTEVWKTRKLWWPTPSIMQQCI